MDRREFMQSAAAATAAGITLAAGPAIHAVEPKAGNPHPVIGTGDYQYECHHGWGQLPDGAKWQTTHGVTVDETGLVYITQQGHGSTKHDTVWVFDADGKFVRSFGKDWHGGGHGIDLRKEGSTEFLYLAYTNGRIVKTDTKGEVVWIKQGPPQEPGVYHEKSRYSPTNVAFTPTGGFWIGDGYGSHYLHEYDAEGKWVRTFGGTGKEPGKLNTPHGQWLDNRPGREPSLVVADRANARLQYFSLDGKHLGFVQGVLYPAHIDTRGDVMLVPDLHARVSLFDKDNQPIVHLGDDANWIAEVKKFKVRTDEKLWKPGYFVHPHDACFDRDGNIFVVEWVQTGRVTKLRRVG